MQLTVNCPQLKSIYRLIVERLGLQVSVKYGVEMCLSVGTLTVKGVAPILFYLMRSVDQLTVDEQKLAVLS